MPAWLRTLFGRTGEPDFIITPAEGEDIPPPPGVDYAEVLAGLRAGEQERRARFERSLTARFGFEGAAYLRHLRTVTANPLVLDAIDTIERETAGDA